MVWTVDDIPDQSGKVIFITGATSGVGYESARVLAARGAHLVLACRNPEKMARVADEFRAAGASAVTELVCDTSDLDSVRKCAAAYEGPDIDVLLLNAGKGGNSFKTTKQGYEDIFATNQTGHFLLTGLLLDKITGRIVTVASIAHAMVDDIDWDAVRAQRPPKKGDMYSMSKLANLVFVEELNRRLVDAGSEVVAVGSHPGFSKTEITEKIENPGILGHVFSFMMGIMGQESADGAWPLLMAVTDENIKRDHYYAPSKRTIFAAECWGPPIPNGKKSDAVTNVEIGKLFWEESEKLVDFKYSF